MTEVEKYFCSILVSAFNEIERLGMPTRFPETLFWIMSSPEIRVGNELLMTRQTLSKVDEKCSLATPKALECKMKETAGIIVKNQRQAFLSVSDGKGKGDSFYILNGRSGEWKSVRFRDRFWREGWFRHVDKLLAMDEDSALRLLTDEGLRLAGRFENLRFALGELAARDFEIVRNPPRGFLEKLEAIGSRIEELALLGETPKGRPETEWADTL